MATDPLAVLNQQTGQARQIAASRQQRDTLRREAQVEAQEAAAKRASEDRARRVAETMRRRLLRDFKGDTQLVSSRDMADERRRRAIGYATQMRRDGAEFTDEEYAAVIDAFGGKNWQTLPSAEELSAIPAARRSPGAGGTARSSKSRTWSEWLFDQHDQAVVNINNAAGELSQWLGELTNDAYDGFQQRRAIEAEATRVSARHRANGTLPGLTAAQVAELSEQELRQANATLARDIRREAEGNITQQLADLDTVPDNIFTQFAAEQSRLAQQYGDRNLSPEAQSRNQGRGEAVEDGPLAYAGFVLQDPVAETVYLGSYLMGSGGVAGGVRAGAARTLGSLKQITAAQKLRGTRARTVAAATGSGGAQTGGTIEDNRARLAALSDEEFMLLPLAGDVLAHLGEGATTEQVRRVTTEVLADRSLVIGTAAGFAGIMLGGQTELLAGTAARAILNRSLSPVAARSGTRGVLRGAAREGTGEAIEEGGQEVAGQVGRDQELDFDSILNSAGAGVVLGGPIGGVTGGLAARAGTQGGGGGELQVDTTVDTRTGLRTETRTDSRTGTSITTEGPIQPALTTADPEVADRAARAISEEDAQYESEIANDATAATGDLDPAQTLRDVVEESQKIRAQIPAAVEAVAEQDAAQKQSIQDRAKLDIEGTSAAADVARQQVAFEAVVSAYTDANPDYAALSLAVSDPTLDTSVAAPLAPNDPLVAAGRAEAEARIAASTVLALPRDTVPKPIVDAVASASRRSSRLFAKVQTQFTANSPEARQVATFNRLVSMQVPAEQATALATRMQDVPRAEVQQVLEDIAAQQPDLADAVRQYQTDFETFRRVSGYRRRLNSFVRAQENADGAASRRIAQDPRFAEALTNMTPVLEAAGVEVPTPESLAKKKDEADALKFNGPARIAAIVSGRSVNPPDQAPPSDGSPLSNPLPGETRSGGLSRASAIGRMIAMGDSADKLRVLDDVVESETGVRSNVHPEYMNSLGRARDNEALAQERVLQPLVSLTSDLAEATGLSYHSARDLSAQYITGLHAPERIRALHLQNAPDLTDLARQQYIAIEQQRSDRSLTPQAAGTQLEALFSDPANYKKGRFQDINDRKYLGMNSSQAAETVAAALAVPGAGPVLEQMGAKMREGSQMVRTWTKEAGVGGDGNAALLDMLDMQYYFPVAVLADKVTVMEDVQLSPRNASRKRMNGIQDANIVDPIERMYTAMYRTGAIAAERSFGQAFLSAVQQVARSGFATISEPIYPTLNLETGRRVYKGLPTITETNKLVVPQADGSVQVITINDSAVETLLSSRYNAQEVSPLLRLLAGGTRRLAKTFIGTPSFMTTSFMRDIQEASLAAVAASGNDPGGSKMRAMKDNFVNLYEAAIKLPQLNEFYRGTAQDRARLAPEFAKSDEPLLRAAAARHKAGGIVGYRTQFGSEGIFLDRAADADPLKKPTAYRASLNAIDSGLDYLQGVMTLVDNLGRDAAYATMVENGVSQSDAIQISRNIMNFDQRAALPYMDKLTALYAFANPGAVGAHTALTRRLFSGNEVPTRTVELANGDTGVTVDWARVPGEIDWTQAGIYAAVGATTVMANVAFYGYEEDEVTGDIVPRASKVSAINFMTSGLLPDVFDEDGEVSPVRIPSQYGVQMLIQGAASGMGLLLAGTHSFEEVIGAYADLSMRVFVPVGQANRETVQEVIASDGNSARAAAAAWSPTLLAPLFQAMSNRNAFGGSNFNEDFQTTDDFFADPRGRDDGEITARINTPPLYTAVAGVFEGTGAVTDTLNLDAPETWRHLARSYGWVIGQYGDYFLKEHQRYLEDPEYSAVDSLREMPGSPARSVNDARYYDMRRASDLLDSYYSPAADQYFAARRAQRNGESGKMLQFRRDYPEYPVMSTLATRYFDELGALNERITEAREDGGPQRAERIKQANDAKETARTRFLQDWFRQFPDTIPHQDQEDDQE